MGTLDQEFAKEFKAMMYDRKSITGFYNIFDISIPTIPSLLTNLGKGEVCLVKDLNEPFFEKLNNTEVQLVTTPVLMERQVLSNGSFWVDKNGDYKYKKVNLENGFIAVHSSKPIGLTRKVIVNGKEKEHNVTKGFRYIDYFELRDERRYIYTLPKENVFKLNLCALIITPNKHSSFYQGSKVALQNGNYLYIYVVPYKKAGDTRGYRVIGTKSYPDFSKEVKILLDYWMEIGVIFDLNMTALENHINGETNLGINDLVGTLGFDDYEKTNHSLGYVPPVESN